MYAAGLSPRPRLPDPVAGERTPWGAALVAVWLLAAAPLPPGRGPADAGLPLLPAAHPFSTEALDREILLARVYANAARDDEFIELANVGPGPADMGGWGLTDREATARFPPGTALVGGGRLVLTRNATAYAENLLRPADFTWDQGDAPHLLGGLLRLADGGDEVLLVDGGDAVVDAYVYGTSDYAGTGWAGSPAPATGRGIVAVRGRGDARVDSDRADDWVGPRPFRLGQSDFTVPPVAVDGPIVSLISPDDGAGPLLAFLGSARSSIHVAVYTLTSEAVAATLGAAARRGVRVRILVEGSPVGGVEDSERELVAALAAGGVEVRWLLGSSEVVKRYRYLHAKYAIVDGDAILVGSENLGESGWPSGERRGNRGWSVIVRDPELAGQLRDVFDEDFDPRRRDSMRADADLTAVLPAPPSVGEWSWGPGACCVRASLVIGPDRLLDAPGVLGLLNSARARVRIEAFYMEDRWGDAPNPFLEGAFAAARRGVDVRILLDGASWSGEETETGNGPVVEAINARADAEGLPLEARLLEPGGPIERVHNKGAVVDGRAVLVTSMNWAQGSATGNREIGIILEDPATASRFEGVFDADWDGRSTARGDPALVDDPLLLAGFYAFVAAASAVSLRNLRRGAKGLKPGRPFERRGSVRAALRLRRGEVRVLPPELVAEPRLGPRGGTRARGRRDEARSGLRGPEGDRDP